MLYSLRLGQWQRERMKGAIRDVEQARQPYISPNTRGGTRTRNLLLRREAPYPLGHTSSWCTARARCLGGPGAERIVRPPLWPSHLPTITSFLSSAGQSVRLLTSRSGVRASQGASLLTSSSRHSESACFETIHGFERTSLPVLTAERH